jgi:response regulator RpfG family c-di-GMP phosphodiesterase
VNVGKARQYEPQLASIIQIGYRARMNALSNEKTRILIVDDEPANIKILSNLLAGDYALSVATSGKQALEVARVQISSCLI